MGKKFKFPHAFVLLFGIIIFVGILTYIIPAGQFEKIMVNGRAMVDPEHFDYIKNTPVNIFEMFKAIPKGINSGAYLIIMILIIGGAIRVFDGSGAIKAAILKLNSAIGKDKGEWVLAAIMLFFGCLGAFPGMLEAAIPFAPLCIGISLALGYDALVGISISLVAIVAGWTAGPSNPWTVGIGQNLAQLPLFSGFAFRLLIFAVLIAVTILFVVKYAKKIKKNPEKSVVYGMNIDHLVHEDEDASFDTRHKLILITFALTIIAVVIGALWYKWGIPEMCAAYIIGAIIGGKFAGYTAGKIADEILEGGKTIFIGAMAVGLARGISVVMDQGNITDTVIFWISSCLDGLPPVITAIGMFITQSVINFFIPSGSGQAMVTLPIVLPIADIVDLNRQIAILAFQFGDGLSNLIYPTVGGLIAFLIYSKVPFNKWIRFIFPYMLMVWGVAILALIFAVSFNMADYFLSR